MQRTINAAAITSWLTGQMGDTGYDYRPKPKTVKVHPDPQVRGTYAVRFTDQNEEIGQVDLLFITAYDQEQDPTATAAQILERTLEEVEYETWPPRSGGLQFFT
jgi:hypothetical protein